jgi:hypothetical protein
LENSVGQLQNYKIPHEFTSAAGKCQILSKPACVCPEGEMENNTELNICYQEEGNDSYECNWKTAKLQQENN